ncbi:MAG TPA: hypothetical protein VE173_00330, partial [Longimicrobiales bacterium]|nr:hypothetical protein [Longimicrobiales bacterium]
YWMEEPVTAGTTTFPAGAFYIPASETDRSKVQTLAREVGLDFVGVADRPAGDALPLRPVRVGLWDQYGGSQTSGWMRYIFENFQFDFDLVYPPDIDEGALSDYDVVVFPSGAIPGEARGGGRGGGRGGRGGGPDEDFLAGIPEQYRDRVGSMTPDTTVPRILDFIRNGGTVVTVGSSTRLAYQAGLPVSNHMVGPDGEELPSTEYYIPGSILGVKLEHVSPMTDGLGDRLDVVFDRSPVFTVEAGATDVRRLGWFDSETPLRSGWAWGQEHLEGGAALLEADVGQGKLFLFGPEITFRAQPHGSFPLLFNAIYYGTAREPGPIT